MELRDAILLLEYYNRWRRGEDESLDMPNPRDIGIALDTVLAAVIEGGTGNSGVERPEPSPHFQRERDEARRASALWKSASKIWRRYCANTYAKLCKLERERIEARQQERIHYDNLLSVQEERDEVRKQLAELKDWQESAISLLNKIQLQEIGGEIGAELGEDVFAKILPAIEKLKRERDQWRECAENLIDYARECLANLSWGSGYTRYNREMDTIRKDIARYERLKEGGK